MKQKTAAIKFLRTKIAHNYINLKITTPPVMSISNCPERYQKSLDFISVWIPPVQTSCLPYPRPRFSCCRRFSRISAWYVCRRVPSACRWYKGPPQRSSSSFRRYGGSSGTEYRKQADEGMRKENVIG